MQKVIKHHNKIAKKERQNGAMKLTRLGSGVRVKPKDN